MFRTAEQRLKRDQVSLAVHVPQGKHSQGFYLDSVKSTDPTLQFHKNTHGSAMQNNQGFLVKVMMSFSRFI
jgi:hypothetical protein